MIDARVEIAGCDPVIASVHIINPLAFYGRALDHWRTGIIAAKEPMAGLAETVGRGAVIVAGDFNSTPDMRQFRDVLNNGSRDAVEPTGAGFAPDLPFAPGAFAAHHHCSCAHAEWRGLVAPHHLHARLRSSCTPQRRRRAARSRLTTGMIAQSGYAGCRERV